MKDFEKAVQWIGEVTTAPKPGPFDYDDCYEYLCVGGPLEGEKVRMHSSSPWFERTDEYGYTAHYKQYRIVMEATQMMTMTTRQ